MSKVASFTLHNARGESILAKDLINWSPSPWRPFNTTSVSWRVDGEEYVKTSEKLLIRVLPDETGLICFDEGFYPDNCFILDAHGQLRHQLTVPWELTGYEVPPDAKMWFRNVGSHNEGQFGVTAWIEYAGDFYFELDYHEGKFLWGKEIRF